MALGFLFGLLSFATLVVRDGTMSEQHKALLLCLGCWLIFGVTGATVGCVCGLAAVPLLSKKRLGQVTNWLLIIISPVVVTAAFIPTGTPFIMVVIVPALAFVAACIWLNRTLEDVYLEGHCQDCGYNLTGLPEPRCPECGTEFDPSTVPRAAGTGTEET